MNSFETKFAREVTWMRTMDNLSFEQAQLNWTASAPHISGMVLATHEGGPLRVEYRVECDAAWQTRRVQIHQCHSGAWTTLCLDHDEDGGWRRNGQLDASLAGCTDVDLGITPSTNTLPIRRLAIGTDETQEIQAAWVRFPDLVVTPARQSYHRVSVKEYIYRNRDSGFTAPVTVDQDGLVEEYGGLWARVAQGPAAPENHGFTDALISRTPSPELGNAAEALGWLAGGWSAEVRDFDANGEVRTGTGEWWFSWVLEGRALQDVWIVPSRALRSDHSGEVHRAGAPNNRYGTTVRWFDCQSADWRIVSVNPVSGALNLLAGKREGDHLILEGEQGGRAIRWSFNDIRPTSFTWRGESRQSGASWQLEAEFRLTKISRG